MSGRLRDSVAALSLRSRFMLIVIGGAILPLALLGAWISASAARSGHDLLQTELDSSLTHIARRVRDRWIVRSGDLALVANNETARRLVAGDAPLSSADAAYLTQLAGALRTSVSDIVYRDQRGRIRWSSAESGAPAGAGALSGRATAGFAAGDAALLRVPIRAANGARNGTADVRVLLSALLPTDSLESIVAAATLSVTDRQTGDRLGRAITSVDDGSHVLVSRLALDEPPLDLELQASDARYVQPFMHAARVGFVSLTAVALLALALTGFLTRRVTASLAGMAEAADAVAGGDLERQVTAAGGDEIRRLAGAFNTMTSSLRRTLDELASREALAAVGRFAASMSHEVRNAVTSVRLDVQRLRERLDNEDQRRLAERVLRNAERLDSIVTGSLRVARISADTMRPVSVEGVVRASITGAEPAMLECGARVELVILDPTLRVRGDARALEQLLINVLMNAAQAMQPGGVARIVIQRREALAVVQVSDTGHGIAPDDLARIGKPFFSSKTGGTGLGLTIAQQIAEAHNGRLTVLCTSAAGTTFELSLPATAPA